MEQNNIVFEEVPGKFILTNNEFRFDIEGKEYSFPPLEISINTERSTENYSQTFKINHDNRIYNYPQLINYYDLIRKGLFKLKNFQKNLDLFDKIKDMLSELQAHDEVKLLQAIEIVKKELAYYQIKDYNLIKLLKEICKKTESFQYVRLKESIRCLKNNSQLELKKLNEFKCLSEAEII